MNNQKINYYELIKETTILTIAIAIIASAVYLFLVPSQTSISSISGLAIIISHYIPLSLSMINFTKSSFLYSNFFFNTGYSINIDFSVIIKELFAISPPFSVPTMLIP